MVISVGEDMEKVEPASTPGGDLKWCRDLENSLLWVKMLNRDTRWPGNAMLRCILNVHEDTSMQILTHVCSEQLIHNSQKVSIFTLFKWVNCMVSVLYFHEMNIFGKREWGGREKERELEIR